MSQRRRSADQIDPGCPVEWLDAADRADQADRREFAREEILARLAGAVERREATRATEAAINDEIRELIVRARDAGATVGTIADRMGVSRAAVYSFMQEGSGSDA